MESILPVITCDGPTCRELTVRTGGDFPEEWIIDAEHPKLHYHSEQCRILGEIDQFFGSIDNSKSMTVGNYLRAIADDIDSVAGIKNRLDIKVAVPADTSSEELPDLGVEEGGSIMSLLLAILQKYPGPHSAEDIRSIADKHGWEITLKQITPALAPQAVRARYPQLKVTKEEREGMRTRNLYSWSK
jgi:hypothetical protein